MSNIINLQVFKNQSKEEQKSILSDLLKIFAYNGAEPDMASLEQRIGAEKKIQELFEQEEKNYQDHINNTIIGYFAWVTKRWDLTDRQYEVLENLSEDTLKWINDNIIIQPWKSIEIPKLWVSLYHEDIKGGLDFVEETKRLDGINSERNVPDDVEVYKQIRDAIPGSLVERKYIFINLLWTDSFTWEYLTKNKRSVKNTFDDEYHNEYQLFEMNRMIEPQEKWSKNANGQIRLVKKI